MKKFALTLLAGTFVSGLASAQSVDYGVLEDIFGEPVTTSATGKPQRVSEAPVAMKIITQEEIRRSGAKDIADVLQRVSGVTVNRPSNGRADVSIRGYNQPLSNRILVLIDGRQVLTDGFGFVPWGQLPVQMNEIRQIEVVKGPNSSLFGFNAEQGVINIITFSPLKDDVDVATAKMGSREHREINAVSTFNFGDDHGLRMSGGFLIADGYNRDGVTPSVTGTQTRTNNMWDRRSFGLDHEWQIDGTSQLRTQVSHANSKAAQLTPFGFVSAPTAHSDQTSFHFNYKKQSDYGLWNVAAYRNTYQTKGDLGYDNDLNVLKVENLFKVGGKHAFRLGTEARFNGATGSIFGSGNSKIDYTLYAPSAMWDWKVTPKLSWTNSVRYDYVEFGRDEAPVLGPFSANLNAFDRKVEEMSFNSGLVYNISQTDKARLSVARGLHIPSLIEMGSGVSLLGGAFGFYGDPTLQTERNLTVELGYNKKLPEHNASVGASVYWTKMENLIAPDLQLGAPILAAFQEGGDSQLVGVELEAEGKYNDWLRWGANYTYTTVNDENDASTIWFEDGTPEHQVSIYGGFDRGNWEFDADLNYVSAVTHTFESQVSVPQYASEKLDAYYVLNARVGYNYNENTSVSIDGFNLVDKHREWLYTNDAVLGPVGANSLGRTVLLSVNHKF